MKRTVVTEQMVRESASRGERRLQIPVDAIVTPLALETASQKGIVLERAVAGAATKTPSATPSPSAAPRNTPAMPPHPGSRPETQGTVAIGADHGGFSLKMTLIEFLRSNGFSVIDVGTRNEEPCDYPEFAHAVALKVAAGEARLGIMIDGAGIGSCMTVNKVPGIRGASCAHEFTARNAREHNDANVLTLGSRLIGTELAKAVVKVFLQTPFAGGRHTTRVEKIQDVERKYLKAP
jgi:ribose 5-phosphate isomerase B